MSLDIPFYRTFPIWRVYQALTKLAELEFGLNPFSRRTTCYF
jgi:hypothetical protein